MRKLLAIGGDGGSVFGVVVQISPPLGVAGAAMGSELVLLIPLVLAPPLLEPDEERAAAAAVPPAAPLERPDVAPPVVLEVVPMWSGGEVSARPATNLLI